MLRIRPLAVSVLLLLAQGIIQAAPHSGAPEFGLFTGAYFGDGTAGIEDDVLYGVRAGLFLTNQQEVELAIDRVDTVFNSATFGPLDDRYTSVAVSWLVNYPRGGSPVVPYLFLGMGQIEEEIKGAGAGTASDDDIYFPWGGGFRVFVADQAAVRFEVRRKDFTTFTVGQESWEISVGLTFLPGRR